MKLMFVYIVILATVHKGSHEHDSETEDGEKKERITIQFDEYNVPIINYTDFEDFVYMLTCLALPDDTYIDTLTECLGQPEILEDIIATSTDYLAKGKAKPEQVDFLRCINSIEIKVDDLGHTKDMLYECLHRFNINEYTKNYVEGHFTRRERREFREFLDCLLETNGANMKEEATDCMQSHPIFVEVVKRFKNPFPKNVYPRPRLTPLQVDH